MADKRSVIQIRIDPDLKAAALAAAEEQDKTLSSYITSLLIKDLLAHKA